MKKLFCINIILLLFIFSNANSQIKKVDKSIFTKYKNEFWDTITKSTFEFKNKIQEEKPTFRMDFSDKDLPKNINEFTQIWHNEPISQGNSNTCWSFSATSFLESEVFRINKKKVKISEMFTVYYEYIEKTKRFIKEKGKSAFTEGSQANAVLRIWKNYGCVPESIYNGLKKNQRFHDHTALYEELKSFLESIKKMNAWNEQYVISTVEEILNSYIGIPPEKFIYNNNEYNPKSFLTDELKINTDDYVDVMSLLQKPFYEKAEYEVNDNWWKCSDYYNVNLQDFIKYLKYAIKNGYSLSIGGDVSEPGYDSHSEVAMIPSFDIPSEYINDNSRQFRFSNGTTTDDHGIHLVGYKEKDGHTWFLIKDSGSGSRNGANKGYYFYDEDYIKLKIMTFTVHRSAVEELLKSFK